MPIFTFENLNAVQKFIQDSTSSNYDLSVLLLAHTAQEAGCHVVLTFDRKASKHSLFQLL
jgi:predicted nucleic-acid-binding protein